MAPYLLLATFVACALCRLLSSCSSFTLFIVFVGRTSVSNAVRFAFLGHTRDERALLRRLRLQGRTWCRRPGHDDGSSQDCVMCQQVAEIARLKHRDRKIESLIEHPTRFRSGLGKPFSPVLGRLAAIHFMSTRRTRLETIGSN